MEKLDLTKAYKSYFTATTQPRLVDIEPARFVSIIGKGDPSEQEFSERVQALYATAYALKFAKKQAQKDFVVSKLEGLWWLDDEWIQKYSMAELPQKVDRSQWQYRLLIRLPEYVTRTDVEEAAQRVATKKQLPLAEQICYFEMNEGNCVQILHMGPFATEPETLAKLQAFIQTNQLAHNGLHHEIYLSDFRKVKPAKLKTILREPVK